MAELLPRMLAAGVGPLPPERLNILFEPGIRIWGMARELARVGHPVRLVCSQFGEQVAGGGESRIMRYDVEPGPDPQLPEGVQLIITGGYDLAWLLAREAAEFEARATISTTDIMNHALAVSTLSVPMWMDFNGDPMAESQLLALRYGSDEGLAAEWGLMVPALTRADRLSGCSPVQCAALLGQLGAVGRLNRHTVNETLVHCLTSWDEPIEAESGGDSLVRGTLAPNDAFVIVQTGGFNTWMDVETLFAGLEGAMAADPHIHFASSGGAIPGHYASGFERFSALVAQSPQAARFHLLGWLPLGQVPRLIQEGDLAVNVDLDCPEGRLGTRKRLMNWLAGGLPVISTPGCDLALELADLELIQLIPHGQVKALTRAILAEAADPAGARRSSGRAMEYLRKTHAAPICLSPLLHWAASPKPASDLQAWSHGALAPPILLTQARDAVKAMQESRKQAQKLAWLERRLARLEGSRLVRWALALRGKRDEDEDPPPDGS